MASLSKINGMGVKTMKLMITKEIDELFRKIEPYLIFEGLDTRLRKDAPKDIKEKYDLYLKLCKEHMAMDLV